MGQSEEGRAKLNRIAIGIEPIETTTTQETWDLLHLAKAYNPYYEHPSVRQHESQRNPLDVGSFMPEPVYIHVSALHSHQSPDAQIQIH
jgi:hypothetical protein